jgi:hypothetical protein
MIAEGLDLDPATIREAISIFGGNVNRPLPNPFPMSAQHFRQDPAQALDLVVFQGVDVQIQSYRGFLQGGPSDGNPIAVIVSDKRYHELLSLEKAVKEHPWLEKAPISPQANIPVSGGVGMNYRTPAKC